MFLLVSQVIFLRAVEQRHFLETLLVESSAFGIVLAVFHEVFPFVYLEKMFEAGCIARQHVRITDKVEILHIPVFHRLPAEQ